MSRREALLINRAVTGRRREYLWVNDLGQPIPKMIMHPTVPALDGQLLDKASFNKAAALYSVDGSEHQALDNANLFASFVRVVGKYGEGVVAYQWPRPKAGGGVTAELYPKLSYVKRFEPWGWMAGSGAYIDDLNAAYWRFVRIVWGLTIAASILTLAVALIARRRILNELGGEVSAAVLAARHHFGGSRDGRRRRCRAARQHAGGA
jgi:methyl-accepting chemotaxis protein